MFENQRTGKRILAALGLLILAAGALYFTTATKTIRAARLANTTIAPIAGEPRRQTFDVEGQQRMALVFENSQSAPKAGAPLVFVFHGHGGTSLVAARKFHIHTEWPEAVVIYPQGLPAPGIRDPEGKKNGWQKGAGELADRDLKFFDAMLNWAKQQYRIDASRIYVAGHSNGGSMAYVLWAARSEVIAAFAPCASVFREALKAKPKPAIIFAGEQDQVVPFAAQKWSLDRTMKLNQCASEGKPFEQGITLYSSPVGADVAAYIYPGDHSLPANTGAVITRFFKQYTLHGKAKAM